MVCHRHSASEALGQLTSSPYYSKSSMWCECLLLEVKSVARPGWYSYDQHLARCGRTSICSRAAWDTEQDCLKEKKNHYFIVYLASESAGKGALCPWESQSDSSSWLKGEAWNLVHTQAGECSLFPSRVLLPEVEGPAHTSILCLRVSQPKII